MAGLSKQEMYPYGLKPVQGGRLPRHSITIPGIQPVPYSVLPVHQFSESNALLLHVGMLLLVVFHKKCHRDR